MKMLKRSLALMLALIMMISAVPFTAFATESTDVPTEAVVDAPESATEPEEVIDETEESVEPTEKVVEKIEIDASVGVSEVAAIIGEDANAIVPYATASSKPAGGTTSGAPFIYDETAGSHSFRIPALVTLSDGTLVAAADARWNTTYDGGGLDTIVSRSTDNGDTWNYSFANYLGDNGNTYNGSGSSCFIDPALAVTANDTIYMLVDLYPYGVALNGDGTQKLPDTSAGFYVSGDHVGKLALSDDDFTTFNYYLDKNTDGTYTIYNNDGTAVEGYTVDAHFNITATDGTSSNLFFSDSPFQVTRTGYLYLTKSTDKGATWSAPQLLNVGRRTKEYVTLVAPGRGLVTSSGMIVFPVYSYFGDNAPSSNSQRMSFIYSTDNGASWTRSADFNYNWASESSVVELSDGTLRFFFRNGTTNLCYVDYANGAWGSIVNTGIDTNSNCELSAITYSKTIDGKQVILVSCPTGPNSAGSNSSSGGDRLNGKMFLGTVEANGTMTWNATTIALDSKHSSTNYFMYSCLTELSDGTVGVLYEDLENDWGTADTDNDGKEAYYAMTYAEFDIAQSFGVTFDSIPVVEKTDAATGVIISAPGLETVEVNANNAVKAEDKVTKTYSITLNGGAYKAAATVKIPYDTAFDGCNVFTGYVDGDEFTVTKDGNYFICNVPHFSEVKIEGRAVIEDTITPSGTAATYQLDSNGFDNNATYLIVYNGNAMAYNGSSFSSISVTENSDGTLTIANGTDISNALWIRQNSGLYNNAQQVYLRINQDSLTVQDSSSNITLSSYNDGYQVYRSKSGTDGYLRYNNGWTYSNGNGNATRVELYKYTAGTQVYKLDAAEQESIITGLTVATNTGYTDDSWAAYQTALAAANAKLAEVEAASYTSETAANNALAELKAAVSALSDAKDALKAAISFTVVYQAGSTTVKTQTMNVEEGTTSVTLPATITSADGKIYSVDTTTLTLSGNKDVYTVSVTELPGTPVTLTQGAEQTISVALASGQYVKWSSADSAYVGVAGVYNTTSLSYTNEAVLKGVQKTAADSPITVIGTVYDADGNVVSVNKWIVTVTAPSANASVVYRYFDVDQIEHCTLYYSINGGELIQINGTGLAIDYIDPEQNDTPYTVIDGKWYDDLSLIFFAAPDEGYALTHMFVENSANQYYVLSDGNADGTGSSAWPLADGVSADAVYTSNGHTYSLSEVASLYLLNQKTIYEAIKSSDDVWHQVDTNNDGTKEDHGLRWALLEGYMDINHLKELYTKAIALGCTGVTTVTKGMTNNENTGTANDPISISVLAQKLPTLDKKISSITKADGTTITGDNVATASLEIGDTLHYTLDVTVYATDDVIHYWDGTTLRDGSTATISYSNINVTDSMYELNWSTNNTTSTTSSTSSDKHLTATYDIKLAASNWLQYVDGGVITNTAELTYHYVASFGTGNYGGSANAAVEAYVVLPEYVVDFGASITIDLTNDPLVAGYDLLKSATAMYGNVTFDEDTLKLTYTPNQILPGMDFIRIEVEDTNNSQEDALVGYGVRIYPATTVYYEEGYMLWGDKEQALYTGDWTLDNAKKYPGAQTAEKLSPPTYGANGAITGYTSGKVNAYGYDPLYADDTTGSNSSYATTSTGGMTTFTFTGTGFELYANSNGSTGYVTVYSKGGVSKLYMINTQLNTGDTSATNQQSGGTYYSLPIISETDLPHGTYTVKVKQTNGDAPIYIDGVRIINTLKNSTPFTIDEEDNPVFHELRDCVLKAAEVEKLNKSDYIDPSEDTTEKDYDAMVDAVKDMAGQVYNSLADEDGEVTAEALILNNGAALTTAQVQDLLDNGPKNELYLYNGNTLTFSVRTDRVMQLGLKSPTGSAKFTLTVNGTKLDLNSLSTTVDMFYKIAAKGGTTHTVSIAVTEGVLSVTDLKICDDPNFTFNALTQDDIEAVLLDMNDLDEEPEVPETPVEPETPVQPEVPTEPSKPTEPVEPEKPTEPEVEETKPSKPSKPSKPGKPSKPSKPGKGEQDTKKLAVLKITYVNMFGRKVGTATLTKEGNGRCTFSPAEIRAAAPAGRRAVWPIPTTINYGTSASIVVPVI